jgi:predicted nucleic acid-binding Zn ribbon protein
VRLFLFLYQMVECEALCAKCGLVTIWKPLAQSFPARHGCGSKLMRRYSPPPVIYKTSGYYSTDVQRLKSQIGSERHAEFEHFKDDAERRAKQGRLTGHERRLEELDQWDADRRRDGRAR